MKVELTPTQIEEVLSASQFQRATLDERLAGIKDGFWREEVIRQVNILSDAVEVFEAALRKAP